MRVLSKFTGMDVGLKNIGPSDTFNGTKFRRDSPLDRSILGHQPKMEAYNDTFKTTDLDLSLHGAFTASICDDPKLQQD